MAEVKQDLVFLYNSTKINSDGNIKYRSVNQREQ